MVEELIAEGVAPEDIQVLLISQFGMSPGDAMLLIQTAQGLPGDDLEIVEDAEYDDDLVEDDEILAAGFTEALHPRYQSGRREGGRFAPKDGTSSSEAQAEALEQARLAEEHVNAQRPLLDPLKLSEAQEYEFAEVAGDHYKMGKMDDATLTAYQDWTAIVGKDFDDEEYRVFSEQARTILEQRQAEREFAASVQPGEVGKVLPMNVTATNPVFTGELDGTKVVVKPQSQLAAARLRTHIEPGFDLEREQAAAHVATLLREDAPTVAPNVLSYQVKDVEGYGPSGVTPFVDGQTVAFLSHAAPTTVGKNLEPDIRKIRLYDGVIGNTDRHDGNIMVSESRRVYPIDHGLSFPDENQEGFVNLQGAYMDTPLDDSERGALTRLRPRLQADTVLPTLLTADQIQAMDDRIGFMLHNDRLVNAADWEKGFTDDE